MSTVNKAMSVLGFIKRWSKEFDDPYTTKLLITPFPSYIGILFFGLESAISSAY